jgi:hypothetical protein
MCAMLTHMQQGTLPQLACLQTQKECQTPKRASARSQTPQTLCVRCVRDLVDVLLGARQHSHVCKLQKGQRMQPTADASAFEVMPPSHN